MKKLPLLLCLGAALSPAGAMQVRAEGAEPLFHEGFDTQADFEKWDIINVEEGSTTWTYRTSTGKPMQSKCAQILKHSPNAAEDWLISPDIQLDASKVYEVSFRMTPGTFNKAESLKAYIGRGKTAEAMTVLLKEVSGVVRGDEVPTYTATFQPGESGAWNIGFLACSQPEMGRIDLDDITVVEKAGKSVPGKVTELSATPGAKGALTATLSFITPAVTASGDSLAVISYIAITRNGEPMDTIPAPRPGQAVAVTDTAAAKGVNTYSVTAVNADGEGEAETCAVFVGPDRPKGVVTARAFRTPDGIRLIWDAPDESQNGGWMDTDVLTYTLTLAGADTVISAGTNREYIYKIGIDEPQRIYEFSVVAESPEGKGDLVSFNRIAAGKALTAPYAESFAKGRMPALWHADSDCSGFRWLAADPTDEQYSDPDIKNYTIYPVDGDDGDLIAENYYAADSAMSRLVLPIMSLDDLASPVARFFVLKGSAMPVRLQISRDGGEWGDLPAAEWADTVASQRWYECMVPLTGTRGQKIQLALLARGGTRRIHIDNFRVEEAGFTRDILVRGGKVRPARVTPGEKSVFTASLRNLGNRTESAYKLRLLRDGQEVAVADGPALDPAQTGNIQFEYTATYADQYRDKSLWQIELADFTADERPANNSSAKMRWSARSNSVPIPEGLRASTDIEKKKLLLKWTAAQNAAAPTQGEPITITDGFEEYTPFLKDTAGDWTIVDGDGMASWNAAYPDFGHKGETMAFQVFNTELGGVQDSVHQDNIFFAHTGRQYLLCVANEDLTLPQDDWLISPRLDGRAQTVSFWAGLPQDFGTHGGIKIGYSMGDNDPDSFVMLDEGKVFSVTDGWRQYSALLPKGARYFAVNVVANSMFLKIDDAVYQRHDGQPDQLDVIGYNVYRDGLRLNSEPLTEANYIDTTLEKGHNYTYRVSTIYAQGESAWSEPVTVSLETVSVSSSKTPDEFFRIVPGGLEIISDLPVNVHTVDGRLTARSTRTGFMPLQQGLYIVSSAAGNAKVMVR